MRSMVIWTIKSITTLTVTTKSQEVLQLFAVWLMQRMRTSVHLTLQVHEGLDQVIIHTAPGRGEDLSRDGKDAL